VCVSCTVNCVQASGTGVRRNGGGMVGNGEKRGVKASRNGAFAMTFSMYFIFVQLTTPTNIASEVKSFLKVLITLASLLMAI